jgi:ABC-type multidrug transport system fused ATPase/permease subunit
MHVALVASGGGRRSASVGTRRPSRLVGAHADRIVVVDESGAAEEGRHDELIAAGGIYRRLHTAQFGTLVV